jgi:hypothetical protein
LKLYSYIVARDFGFAPNPFYGVCTLATCKPVIRATAQIGDWIIGTGSKKHGLDGHLVYAMQVSEILTYDEYWADKRFASKRPNLHGSLKQAYGDNIYNRDPQTNEWIQADSHHSNEDGSPNHANVEHDTQSENVLIGNDFYYWGGSGPLIPEEFRNYDGCDLCHSGQGHRCNFPEKLLTSFIAWLKTQEGSGFLGEPAEFTR